MLKVKDIKEGDILVLTKAYPLYNPYYPVGEKFVFTGISILCGYRTLLRVHDTHKKESKLVYIPLGYLKKEI